MEIVRNIKIHVEVDTNKDTYVLDLPDVMDADVAVEQVREFLDSRLS